MLFVALQFSYLYIFLLSIAWNVTYCILHVKHFTTLMFFGIREVLLIKTREGIVEMFWDHLRQKCQISFCSIETLISIGIYASIVNSLLKYYHRRSFLSILQELKYLSNEIFFISALRFMLWNIRFRLKRIPD